MRVDCSLCGGSGGGEGYWRCPECRGSGTVYANPDDYGTCVKCGEITFRDYLYSCEDSEEQVCEDCVKQHGLCCPECGGHFENGVELQGVQYCTQGCVDQVLEDRG